jgi:ferric iron reductase protein FhuF
MTTPAFAVDAALDPLGPVRAAVAALAARPDLPPPNGLAPGLTVTGWTSAADLTNGALLDDFLDTAKQRWRATPHVAAALAWKCYAFWLTLPAVLGYATAARVPLLRPEAVRVHWSERAPFVTVGITPTVEVAVLPSDPMALTAYPGLRVVAGDAELLAGLRASLMDEHLAPIMDRMRDRVHIGRRTLWGSVASGIAHGLSRAADVLPVPVLPTTERILAALGLDSLVELSPRPGGAPGLIVQRRTCCLAFTLPEPKICTGCCIR